MQEAAPPARPALRSREALPFLACALLGFGVLALPPHDVHRGPLVAGSVLFVVLVAAGAWVPWERWPWGPSVPPLAYLPVVALLHQAAGGGESGVAILVALPVLWFALTGGPRSLAAAVLGGAVVFAVPLAVVGSPVYSASEWRRVVIWVALASLVGSGIQSLLARLRDREAQLSQIAAELTLIGRQWERFSEKLPDTVVLVVDADLRFCQVSGAGELRARLQGWQGRTLAETATPADIVVLEPLFRAALRGRPGSGEVASSVHSTPHQVTVVPYEHHGAPAALVVARDVGLAQQRELEARRTAEEMRVLAEHDSLTGLLNRRAFDGALAQHLADLGTADLAGPRGAVLAVDIDHFKRVNDAWGHHEGDRLIVAVAELLTTALREHDVVARLGGDEFAMLLPEADQDGADQVAQRVVEAVRRHAAGRPEVEGAVTVSVGIRLITDTTTSGDELLAAADAAMYEAKRTGRDRSVMATG